MFKSRTTINSLVFTSKSCAVVIDNCTYFFAHMYQITCNLQILSIAVSV